MPGDPVIVYTHAAYLAQARADYLANLTSAEWVSPRGVARYPGPGEPARYEVVETATGRVTNRAWHRGDPNRPSAVRDGEPMVPLLRGFEWRPV